MRRRSLVVWLDADATYCDFVDRLIALRAAEDLPYPVYTFRGSFLELLFELEPWTSGVSAKSLVVHMPGFNSDSIRETPLLEMYLAGVCFQKKLETLIGEAAAGKVLPVNIDAFRRQKDLTLADADAWLTSMLSDSGSTLAGQLRLVSTEALVEDLLIKSPKVAPIASQINSQADLDAVWDRLGAAIGLPVLWRDQWSPQNSPTVGSNSEQEGPAASAVGSRAGRPAASAVGSLGGVFTVKPDDIAFVASSWALSVEYVDDLERLPVDAKLAPATGLAKPLIQSCLSLAEYLRERHADFYTRTADETEASLPDETLAARPEDLGKIDTFRFEEEEMLTGALGALSRQDWAAAQQWARRRLEEDSFWLRREAARRSAWLLIADAAELGVKIAEAGSSLEAAGDHQAAIERYTRLGAAVDRAHRQLEQRRHALLVPRLPEFERLRMCLDAMRLSWRGWADGWAHDFNALCKNHGFLPPGELQQRNFFDQVVAPIIDVKVTTALFVVDAFRYEMAQELLAGLGDEAATTCRLDARLAELPTITAVGMNVLAPVVRNGRLKPAIQKGSFQGFSTGEYRVSDPDSRKRAMHDRVGGTTCPRLSLREVVDRDTTSLKRSIAKARLVIVHSKEIDAAGEADFGPAVFDSVMKNLRAAWRLLREAGVKQFVFTADHGFLLRDGLADAQSHGRKIDPNRRHVLSKQAANQKGEVRVSLADLGYDDTVEHVIFPETTATFDTGDRSRSFVHGGNSLQERVIPVLTLSHRLEVGGNNQKYRITGKAEEGVGGMHCLSAKVVAVEQQRALDFGSQSEVELAMRIPETDAVAAELCQVRRGRAKLLGGSIVANVDEEFEIFFRLRGDADQRVQVELYHPGAEVDVTPMPIERRFAVEVSRSAASTTDTAVPANDQWLSEFPEGGVRQLFQHLAEHGAVTESEASTILGGGRKLRRFATQFEYLAAKAPFEVRIDVIGGVKRYVRETQPEYVIQGEAKNS